MRQPVDNAIQYGANEGISSPSRVLYSFLQPLSKTCYSMQALHLRVE